MLITCVQTNLYMSIRARAGLYFKYAVAARFRLTPAPSTAKEVAFLFESFGKLGTLEYFHIPKLKHLEPGLYDSLITVVYNPSEQFSQLDPFTGTDPSIVPKLEELKTRQSQLKAFLRSICGLPRYSYVENDRLYFSGSVHVPFKHVLVPSGMHLQNTYTLTSSTILEPFVTMSSTSSPHDVVVNMRHNFQKYHKVLPEWVETGPHGVHLAGGKVSAVDVLTPQVDTESIMNLDEEPQVREKQKDKKGRAPFSGFL